MVSIDTDKNKIYQLLGEIPDPEIPVITILDLGVVRKVEFEGDALVVSITPTYSGCPAMQQIEHDVKAKLTDAGYEKVQVKTTFTPAWTTDWISDDARERLRKYGIAPPQGSADKSSLTGEPKVVPCPQCGSKNTQLTSQFGSTPCKALYKCLDCLEPFDYFKCI